MKTIQAHEAEAVVEADGSVRLPAVPFRPGQKVEIIVLQKSEAAAPANAERYPLRGKHPYRFDDPFSPVGMGDWELLK